MGRVMRVQTLGGIRVDGAPARSGRALELVAILALSGGVAPRDWLLENLFETPPSPSSLPTLAMRARRLGLDVAYDMDRCRYRLAGRVSCDVVEVLDLLREGCISDVLKVYHGPFIPRSHSPFAMGIRGELEKRMSDAAIRSSDSRVMIAVDRVVKHPELSMALLRSDSDPSTVSLSRSWLGTLGCDQ